MDYQVFLVSRMHEEVIHGATPTDAVRDGFRHSARVVTAAGLIMISVFSGFILPGDPIIKSIGLAFATGILIDAFLVRMTLIPAADDGAGPQRLVAAALARPDRAERRHRGRLAREADCRGPGGEPGRQGPRSRPSRGVATG